MNITVVFQLPRELKIGSAWSLGLLEGATKWCRAHSTTILPFPAALSSVSSEQNIWEEGKRSGWSPLCWFLPSTSILAYLYSILTRPAAPPQCLAFSIAGETLTPELNAFGQLIMESGV